MRASALLIISFALLGAAMANQFTLSAVRTRPALDDIAPFKHNINFTEKTYTYFSCDGPVEHEDWTYARNFGTLRCGDSLYLARFGKSTTDYVTANIALNHFHQGVAIRGRIIAIDEWEGETFTVYARTTDGAGLVPVFTKTFTNPSTDNRVPSDTLCGQSAVPDTATTFQFGFAHNLATLELRFSAELDGAECSNAWGVCDLEIHTVACTLKPDGTCEPHPEFPCFKPIWQADWTYSDGYRMETCGTQRYLGRYGKSDHQQYIEKIYNFEEKCPIRGFKVAATIQFIESWDGEKLEFVANGQLAHTESRLWRDGVNVCGNTRWGEHLNQKVVFGVNSTENTATQAFTLRITSTLDQAVADEGWGVCDLTVTALTCKVDKTGECIRLEPRIYTAFTGRDQSINGWTAQGGAAQIGLFNVGQRKTFGLFGANDVVTRTFDNLPAHQSVTVRVRVYSIDSWEGETFRVAVDDGENVVNIPFNHNDQHRAELAGDDNVSDEWRNVEFTVRHSGETLRLHFTSTLDEALTDEAWSISDLVVFVNPCPVGEAPVGDQFCPAGGDLAGNLAAVKNNGGTGEINYGTNLNMDECAPITPDRNVCNNGCTQGDTVIYPLLRTRPTWFRFADTTLYWSLNQ